jgi:hypothetical protein
MTKIEVGKTYKFCLGVGEIVTLNVKFNGMAVRVVTEDTYSIRNVLDVNNVNEITFTGRVGHIERIGYGYGEYLKSWVVYLYKDSLKLVES